MDLAFGTPLYVGAGDDLTERTHELGHEMTELLEGLQQLPHHRPRPGEVATWYPAHLGGQAPTRQEGLWFHGGNLHQSRHYSQFLALQLKARMEAIPTPVYGLAEVHHVA